MPKASTPTVLAVDLGTSGIKVALVDLGGNILGWETEPVRLIVTPDGGAEQVPEEWWQALVIASRRLLSRELTARQEVRAVCCSTQGEGTIPMDRDGECLMNCVLWMDMRGAPYLRKRFGGFPSVNGASLWRVLRWIHLTGGMPSMTGKDPAGHMLLIREHFPKVYDQTHKFLNVLDYLNLRLTGRWVATHDSILTSWVTDNRDPRQIRYHAGLLRDSGIDPEKFPEIVPCTQVLGSLLPEVATELGLSPNTEVVAGSIDTAAAAVGAGTTEPFAAHCYLGTSSWMAAHVPFKKTDALASLASVPCALPDHYLLTALQATAGGNLTFLRDKILYHQDELLQEAHVPDIFQFLDQMAARVPPGSRGVLYTPWIWGERAPVEDRSLRAGLHNLSLHNNREDIIRAFLEGVAFNSRWLLGPVQRFLRRQITHLDLVGGGAQSDVWCQIYADILGLPIRQMQDPIQANARGAAMIAWVALREITFADVPGRIQVRRTFEPNAAHRGLYDERFAMFLQLYRRLKGIYRRLNDPPTSS